MVDEWMNKMTTQGIDEPVVEVEPAATTEVTPEPAPAEAPVPAAAQVPPYTGPETYGVYSTTEIAVNEKERLVTISVELRHGVKKTIIYPWPILAACAFDNPDAYCLEQGRNLKP